MLPGGSRFEYFSDTSATHDVVRYLQIAHLSPILQTVAVALRTCLTSICALAVLTTAPVAVRGGTGPVRQRVYSRHRDWADVGGSDAGREGISSGSPIPA